MLASEKTSLRSEAAKERDQLLARRKEACLKELSQINDTIDGLERQGEIQKAVGYLRSVRNRHATPDWTGPIERSLEGMLGKERSLDRANRALGSVPRDGLALWLRSDTGITLNGTRVSRWNDQSDQHRDASEDRESRQPTLLPDGLGGNPALSFDGSHTSMTFDCPVNGLGGMTLFLVSACTGDCPKGSGSDSAALYWDAGGPHGKLYLGSFQTKLTLKFGAGRPAGDLSFTRPASLSTRPSLTVMEKEGPVDRLYVDGTPVLTQTGMGSKIAECQDRGFLGIGKNDTHFSGLIAEVLIFSRALGDPDRQSVERYLMDKYRLPAK